jgi:hypothetical protein
LVAWTKNGSLYDSGTEGHLARVSSSGTADYAMPFNLWGSGNGNQDSTASLVLGEGGVAFAVGYSYSDGFESSDPVVVSFNFADGNMNWNTPLAGVLDCLNNWPCEVHSGIVAATEGNGAVVVQPTPAGASYVAQVVQLDSTGSPIGTWTTESTSVQYDYGDQWTSLGSTDAHSGPAILWPWSVWAEPTQDNVRSPNPAITAQLYRVTGTGSDGVALDQMIRAANFWQEKAGILLEWLPSVTQVDACDATAHPNDCGIDETYDISSIPTAPTPGQQVNPTVAEIYRRFCGDLTDLQPYCKATGSQLLFTQFVDGSTLQGGTPGVGGTQINLSFLGQDAAGLTTAHELGHQFQLQHCILCGPLNLMYSFINLTTPGSGLSPNQIAAARKGAHKWSSHP